MIVRKGKIAGLVFLASRQCRVRWLITGDISVCVKLCCGKAGENRLMKQAFCSWSSEGEELITNIKKQYLAQANIDCFITYIFDISASLLDEEMDVCCFCTLFLCIYNQKTEV